ncbi:hypothetical protein CHH28_18280 [Bacterioplanes sanyensis]|uniref:Uncharacterized protein n=1 Tax=Bacterioplanes sanyensis TaxID=1249553 RepID=A0A222FN90_9GAMM|nr:hypothetical protein [Bacterioplanes sanyensis]ASP40495.1 hypothetical protein CHH28_18280 [Bacterioplanes sanyensis]
MTSPLGLKPDLPVVDITSDAASLLWQKRTQVMRMFLPVLLLLAAIDWLSQAMYPVVEDAVVFQPSQLIFMLASLFISILMATACHRFTLLPQDRWHANALHGFRRDEWRYLLRSIVIGLVVVLLAISIAGIGIALLGKDAVLLVGVVTAMLALYVMSRLAITLPAIALGQHSPLKQAWELSRGNGSRLVLVVFLIPMLLGSPFMLLLVLDSGVGVLSYLASFGIYITSLISLVMLSLAYQFLCDLNDVDALQEPAEVTDNDNHFDA